MLRVSRMKSLLTLSPTLPNSFAGPLSHFTGLKTSIRLRDTASTSSFKNYSFSPQRSILNVGSARACHSRGFCAEARDSGEIHIVVGPMFAGKTTTLLKRMKAEISNGRRVAIIKSDKDTRYGTDSVVTHDGESFPCLPLADLASFREKLGVEAYDKLEVIGIDEAQFFKDLYDFCSKAADQDGKTIIVAGLDGDYRRRSFGSVLDIIPIADSVTKLTSRCEVCGKHASFTLRKTDDTKTELIGGADVYMPVCRKHYASGQVVKEVSKAVIESHTRQVYSFVPSDPVKDAFLKQLGTEIIGQVTSAQML